MAPKPYVGKEVIEKIAALYIEDKKVPAKILLDKVNEWLKDKGQGDRQISLSLVQRELAKYHKKEKEKEGEPNPLDQPWSIGACEKYGIPADMIPVLIQIQQFAQRIPRVKITIRQARWFARLYPTVQKMMTKKQPPNIAGVLIQLAIYMHVELDREESKVLVELFKILESAKELSNQGEKEQFYQLVGLAWLALIGVQYARQEQVSELIGEPSKREFDTSALDNLYFIREDISGEALLDGFRDTYDTPEQKKQRADYSANFKGLSAEELEALFGKQLLTQNQIDMANDHVRAFLHSAVRGREWMEQHPEAWAELIKLWEAKEHERTHSQAVSQ